MNAITILQAIILGAVQGSTEFLPVSSSGHLLLAANILDIPTNFAAETLLSFGTIVVIVIFFWKQIWRVARDLVGKTLTLIEKRDVLLKLMIGVAPTVAIGVLFGDFIDANLHGTNSVVIMLILLGIPMILVKPKNLTEGIVNTNIVQEVSYKQAVLIGLAQPLALISGTSRSGVTILAGIISGLKIEVAAAFSFLVGLPIIIGATLKLMFSSDGREFLDQNLSAFIAGNIASFIVGLVAVYVLMDVVKKKGLKPFGFYRVALGVAVALFVLL